MVNFFYLDKNPNKCAKYYCDKHVNKIAIEILQLQCNIIHNNTNLKPPYKKCKNISLELAPYKWANKSKSNYLYLLNLADSLLQEYKFRYDKETHKSEIALNWLKNNIPNHFKLKNRTKLIYTKNINLFNKYIKDDIKCSRFIYVVYKCKKDKWTKRDKPEWISTYYKIVEKERLKYKDKLLENVKIKLPKYYKNNKNIKVKIFHSYLRMKSYLRIIYDNMFGMKWLTYIKQYKNIYDVKISLIDQLSFIHLMECYKISLKLFNINKLNKLNNNSLKFRNKLK